MTSVQAESVRGLGAFHGGLYVFPFPLLPVPYLFSTPCFFHIPSLIYMSSFGEKGLKVLDDGENGRVGIGKVQRLTETGSWQRVKFWARRLLLGLRRNNKHSRGGVGSET